MFKSFITNLENLSSAGFNIALWSVNIDLIQPAFKILRETKIELMYVGLFEQSNSYEQINLKSVWICSISDPKFQIISDTIGERNKKNEQIAISRYLV